MVSIGGSGHINDQLRHRRARAEQTQNSKANPWRGRRLPPEAGTAMCSFLHKSLRWECNRETRQIHEKKSVARALYFRPPSSTGANGGNRGSSLSPLPPLPPVQNARAARSCRTPRLSDPAPETSCMKPRRYRGVRCSRLVRLPFPGSCSKNILW